MHDLNFMHISFSDFYEEVLSLIYSLTSAQVSHHMWQVFAMLYEMFQKDGIDYFTGEISCITSKVRHMYLRCRGGVGIGLMESVDWWMMENDIWWTMMLSCQTL